MLLFFFFSFSLSLSEYHSFFVDAAAVYVVFFHIRSFFSRYVTIILEIILVTTLLFNSRHEKHQQKYGQKDQIAPPDNRIAKQVDAVSTARKELTLFYIEINETKTKMKVKSKKMCIDFFRLSTEHEFF